MFRKIYRCVAEGNNKTRCVFALRGVFYISKTYRFESGHTGKPFASLDLGVTDTSLNACDCVKLTEANCILSQ